MLPLKLIPMRCVQDAHLLELGGIKMFFKTVSYTFTKRRPRPN
jgi:hypothetical protein